MEPTLFSNNVLVTERLTSQISFFERGDIIVARCPTKPEQFICKRIVGMPGDKILLKPRYNFNPFDNKKSILRSELEEVIEDNVTDDQADLNLQELSNRAFLKSLVIVPRGHVWLEGDNSENSLDSRTYGPVPMGLIRSRILCRLWPPSDFKLFVN